MDRRSWPWKKKSSSDKAATEKALAVAESVPTPQAEKDNYKKPNYVQLSVEQYSHLTGLEDQVKNYESQVKNYENQVNAYEDQVKTYEDQFQTLEDQITDLNEQLSTAHSEISTQEGLVKQHAKVAEEAVSGWEKAEAEALALKTHLESVTLLKLTAEDRASHLDGALKECMRQIRNLKEDHEQKLQEVVFTKTKQCDKIKHELETRIANLDQELLRSAAENAAISRSLQERSNMLYKINEEKSQAEAEIERFKSNIESCEREINSLKYELHIASKELEIRTEEKNMSVRSADAANKQHMEGVKKITKLEAECQRLRGLVRKKLPGPAALAQMKLEVESLGRDYGETRLKRSPVKASSPHMSQVTEFSLDNVQKFQKENEFLTERLLAMEEETKMLKEALSKRNSELQVSRSICAKTVSKLQTLEAQLQISGQQKGSPTSVVHITTEGSLSQNASNPPSFTSMSEDGNDDDRSCAESWSTTLNSDLSHIKKERNNEKSSKAENQNHLNLMDDFLEMEKLACLPNDSNGDISVSDSPNNKTSEIETNDASGEVTAAKDVQSEQQHDSSPLAKHQASSNGDLTVLSPGANENKLPLVKLRSRISVLLELLSKDTDFGKVIEDIKHVVQEAQDTLHPHTVNCVSEEIHSSDAICDRQAHLEGSVLTTEKEITAKETMSAISEELASAISLIHDFVLLLGKKVVGVHDTFPDGNELSQKIEEFSGTYSKVIHGNLSLVDLVLDLSHVLANASELKFNVIGFQGVEAGRNSPDCIDKVALPENKVVEKDSSERYQNHCVDISNHSNPEVPDDGNLVSSFGSNATPCKISVEEFEQLKSEKDNLSVDLARCAENLEMTTSKLQETEQLLAEAKTQFASAQNSNNLNETQLKCMAESYRSLESRAHELETELKLLQVRTETLEKELQEEKRNHQDALARCTELQEELKRQETLAAETAAEMEFKTKQDMELADAAEKLAECQETIFLLGKQLKSLHPQPETMGSPYSERSQKVEGFTEDEPTTTKAMNLHDSDQAEIEGAASTNVLRAGGESPIYLYNAPRSPSDTDGNNLLKSPGNAKTSKHRPTKSSSSSGSSSNPTPEKHPRGFSRFFSSKGKNGY